MVLTSIQTDVITFFRQVLEKCGFQPRGEETQVYALDERYVFLFTLRAVESVHARLLRVLWIWNTLFEQSFFSLLSLPGVLLLTTLCKHNIKRTKRHADGDGGMLCLAGTAEVPLAALHMDQTLQADTLPLKLAGVSHCFRAEAGGAGANSRGLYRVHQFTKVEMFAITAGDVEESDAMLEALVDLQQEMYSELGLHYRVLDMPTLELGAPAYRKYDIEAWMPGRGIFGEVSSASNCTDYQSRRLNTRYSHKAGGGGSKHVHTLNGTAIAVPRIIVALLETGQQEDGSVLLPQVLAPFFGGRLRITAPEKH